MQTIERRQADEESTQSGRHDKGTLSLPLDPSMRQPGTYRRKLHDAITSLYAVFDETCAWANEARRIEGVPDLIVSEARTDGRLYSVRGYHGSKRTISLFPVLPIVDADHFGGVYVTPSGAAGPIYLIPAATGGPSRWWVLRTWQPFTARDAEEMFLAVFEGDAPAGKRMARFYGTDLSIPTLSD